MTDGGGELQAALRGEVLAVLTVYCQGLERAITGRRLAAAVANGLAARGFEVTGRPASLARRCRAAIADLVASGEKIGSASSEPRGYFIATDLLEFAAGARTLRRHLIGTAQRLRAYDKATAEAVLRALGQEPLSLPRAAPAAGEGA